MYSCQSPVSSSSAISTTVNVISPKKDAVTMSLNGLFGDVYGFDDNVSFSTQSPSSRNVGKVMSVSPSKSLSMELNYNQQPVLLSDLADSGVSGTFLHKSRLCSYVSPYDNSRCTNLAAIVKSDARSFCQQHREQATLTTRYDLSNLVAITSSALPNTNKVSSVNVQRPILTSCASSVGYQSNSKLKLNQENKANSLFANGLSFPDVRTTTPNYKPVTSRVMFPVSYISSRDHLANAKKASSSSSSNIPSNIVRAVPVVAATVVDSTGKTKSIQIKPGNVHPGGNNTGAIVPMDRNTLQAFVDFLNQNHDRLTPKQQLNLLNSLGVAVATVKNPNDLILPTSKPQMNSKTQNVFNLTAKSNLSQHFASDLNHSTNTNITSALKRKLAAPTGDSSKKIKLGSSVVSDVSHQQQGFYATSERFPCTDSSSPDSFQKKPKRKASLRPINCSSPYTLSPLPTVTVAMNQLENHDVVLRKSLCDPVKKYSRQIIDNQLAHHNLFPLGPFCCDRDAFVCRCPSKTHIIPIPPKLKNKILLQNRTKPKLCSKCKIVETNDSTLTFFDAVLSAVTFTLSFPLRSPSSDTTTHPTTAHKSCSSLLPPHHTQSYCRHLKSGMKTWKRLKKEEDQSIRQLVAAARSNAPETASLLKSIGQTSSVRLKKRSQCGVMPVKCSLTDRNGDQCLNSALPLASFCRNHVMHSSYQQLYKLDASMNVVADTYPDPPVVKQRKKTKLPPLSKRKKRRTKKRNPPKKVNALPASSSTISRTTTINMNSVNKFKSLDMLHPPISDYIADNSNDTLTVSNSVKMPSVIDDGSLSFKNNLLSENFFSSLDDDSNSGMFEALSFDGEELLKDVAPEMFSELGLDNAFLLTASADSIQSTFDEFNDDAAFCQTDAKDKEVLSSINSSQAAESSMGDNILKDIENINLRSFTTTDSETLCRSYISSSIAGNKSEVPGHEWRMPEMSNPPLRTIYSSSTTPGSMADMSSSLDSSFAEDLNEIKSVLDSLRDEPILLEADEKRDIPQDWNAVPLSTSANIPTTMTTDSDFLSSTSSQYSNSIESLNGQSIKSSNLLLGPSLQSQSSTTSAIFNSLNFENVQFDSHSSTSNINTQFLTGKVVKKLKSKASPRKRKVGGCKSQQTQAPSSGTSSLLGGSQVNMSLPLGLNNPSGFTFTKTSTGINAIPSKSNPTVVDKSKFENKGNLRSSGQTTQTCVTVNAPIRMQPKILSAGLICSGKANSPNMVLIPYNPTARTSNQGNLPGGNGQNLAIALAIPNHNLGTNISTVIPIKGSAFVSGAGTNQQVFLLGGNSTLQTTTLQGTVDFNQIFNASSPATAKTSQTVLPRSSSSQPRTFLLNKQTDKSTSQQFLSQNTLESSKNSLANSAIPHLVIPSASSSIGHTNSHQKKNLHSILISTSPLSAVNHNTTSKSVIAASAATKLTTSPTPVYIQPASSNSTLHWSQTTNNSKSLQSKSVNENEGQASNIMLCRRLNSSLANRQHVIVGRLGSLGQIGMSRVALRSNSKTVESHNSNLNHNPPTCSVTSSHGSSCQSTMDKVQSSQQITNYPALNKKKEAFSKQTSSVYAKPSMLTCSSSVNGVVCTAPSINSTQPRTCTSSNCNSLNLNHAQPIQDSDLSKFVEISNGGKLSKYLVANQEPSSINLVKTLSCVSSADGDVIPLQKVSLANERVSKRTTLLQKR